MKPIYILIVLVLLGLGGYYYVNSRPESSQPTTSTREPAAVESTSDTETASDTPDETPINNEVNEDSMVVAAEVHIITYTDNGFSPATVNVRAGDTVRFVNDAETLMWVASATHPTHEQLPEFDQLEAVGKGEAYEFTFEEVGSWNYHNHMRATHFGRVIVE